MIKTRTKRLGQILIEAGFISPEQLDLALTEQKQTKEKLGRILQRLGLCTEEDLARLLADQAGVEYVSLTGTEIPPEVVELVPSDFARANFVMPLRLEGHTLVLAMVNPLALETIDAVTKLTGQYVEAVHATDVDIKDAHSRYYEMVDNLEAELTAAIGKARAAVASGTPEGEEQSPYVRLVDLLLQKGIDEGATDIHLEPEEKTVRSRFRIDGLLELGPSLAKDLQSVVTTRLKILAGLNISESRVPQDGRILHTIGSRQIDLRVSTFPTVYGENFVCRILDKQNLVLGIEKVGMHPDVQEIFQQDISRPHGIILVTGPTGSGKTTTLYSALTMLNRPDTKIITLEDPVEYELPVINQAQVDLAKGFTFARGLRAILRQDPDILLVGEIRDEETAQLAIRAALTGHLVFSTLHTNSAAGAIPRLLNMDIEPYLLSSTLVGVLAQRLVRRVCPDCRSEHDPDPEESNWLSRHGHGDSTGFKSGSGCGNCRDTGYVGRRAVFEYLRVDEQIRRLINEDASLDTLHARAIEAGMRSLADDTLDRAQKGDTTLAETMRVLA